MRYLLGVLGVIATFGLMVVAAWMNWLYQHGLGRSPAEADALGYASIALDFFKVASPTFAVLAWKRGRYDAFVAAIAVGVLTLGFGFYSAFGFNLANRNDVTGNRDTLNLALKTAEANKGRLDAKFNSLRVVPPTASIDQSLQAMKVDRFWQSSKACEDATAATSREFCKRYFDLTADRAVAAESAQVTAALGDIDAEIAKLRGQGAGRDSDPLVAMLMRFIPGLGADTGKLGVTLFPAFVVEVVAAFGLLISTSAMMDDEKKPAARPVQPVKAELFVPAARKPPPAPQRMLPLRPMRVATDDDGELIVED